MSLKGMVALVTGGAQGIGMAVVHSLMQDSAKVSAILFSSDHRWLPADRFVHATQNSLFS